MDETTLRNTMGDSEFERMQSFIQGLQDQGKSAEEIKTAVAGEFSVDVESGSGKETQTS